MFRKKQTSKTGRGAGLRGAGLEGTTTLVAHNTRLNGDLLFADQLYVNGEVHGDISALDSENLTPDEAKVIVCEGGRIIGDIRAPNVVIDGTVEGDVYATGKLELAARAKVLGNVHYNLVEMQLGSVVNGQMISLVKDESTGSGQSDSQSESESESQTDSQFDSESDEGFDKSERTERSERSQVPEDRPLTEEELANQKMRDAMSHVVTGMR